MTDQRSPILSRLQRLHTESNNLRNTYDNRWQRNIRLNKGIPLEDKTTKSEVRGRSKIYYRKIWSTGWRLTASFYQSFLREHRNFKLQGRDTIRDPHKAKVLQFMTEYRIDRMMRTQNLFLKHIWAIRDGIDLGLAVGKLGWQYNKELKIDDPVYTLYPVEQVGLDLSVETSDLMRYVIFDNYLTEDDLKEMGYDNIEKTKPGTIPSSQVRSSRYLNSRDPLQNPGPNEYPEAGRYEDDRKDDQFSPRYIAREIFYKEKGKIKFCVVDRDFTVFYKEPKDSPYGDIMPVVMGTCLTEQHKLIGEGFPEPLEGPQESYNYNLNMRKDNVALAMNRPTIISRYGNVDLNALVNRTAGKGVLADDINALREFEVADVTGSSYKEAAADEYMMQEMSGVTPSQSGMSDAGTATEAQMNLSQGNAKIELYLAIFGETYFRSFYSTLARMIQKFETDDMVFRIANDKLGTMVVNVDDFDADVVMNVGMSYAGKDQEIRQTLLILDRGAVYNQSQMQLMELGAIPKDGFKFFNGAQMFEDLLPLMGKEDLSKYFVPVQPPPPPQTPGQKLAGVGGNGGMQGATAPQVGDMNAGMAPQNMDQAGAIGGY